MAERSKQEVIEYLSRAEVAAVGTSNMGTPRQRMMHFGADEDFNAAKVLAKFAKTHTAMELVGGFNAEGTSMSQAEVTALGNLPTKNELIAQVVDTLLSGINGIVSGLENREDKATA